MAAWGGPSCTPGWSGGCCDGAVHARGLVHARWRGAHQGAATCQVAECLPGGRYTPGGCAGPCRASEVRPGPSLPLRLPRPVRHTHISVLHPLSLTWDQERPGARPPLCSPLLGGKVKSQDKDQRVKQTVPLNANVETICAACPGAGLMERSSHQVPAGPAWGGECPGRRRAW